jgi:ethanolamine transporter EutH
MIEQDKKTGRTIKILVSLIILLILAILVMFVGKPQAEKYILNKQIEAYNLGRIETITAIITQIQQKGGAEIVIGNESLILVPYTPTNQQLQ